MSVGETSDKAGKQMREHASAMNKSKAPNGYTGTLDPQTPKPEPRNSKLQTGIPSCALGFQPTKEAAPRKSEI